MATGDPTAVEVLDEGFKVRVRFEGLSALAGTAVVADFDTGFSPGGNPTTAASNFYFVVTSEGYDETGSLGTIERTVYATIALRQPYPDQADLEASADSGDLLVDFTVNERIYDDDTATCVIKSGLHSSTNAGTPTVTNNSDLDYPPVTAFKWVTPAGQRLGDTFSPAVECAGAYGQDGRSVACVVFTLTDSSANSVSATVTTPTRYYSTRDPTMPVLEVYQPTLDTTGLDDDEAATLRVQVYPFVGDADSVFDTDDATYPDKKATQPHHIGGTVYYAYVDENGDNGTAVASTDPAVAKANPYTFTWAAVLNGVRAAGTAGSLNNCVVRYRGGQSHDWGRTSASTSTGASAFPIFESDPDDEELATFDAQAASGGDVRCNRVRIRNMIIAPSGSSSNFFEEYTAGQLYQIEGLRLQHSGVGTTLFDAGVAEVHAFDCLAEDFVANITTCSVHMDYINCEFSHNVNEASMTGWRFDTTSDFGGGNVFTTSAACSPYLNRGILANDGDGITLRIGHECTNAYFGPMILVRYGSGTQPGIDLTDIAYDNVLFEHVTCTGARTNIQNAAGGNKAQTRLYPRGCSMNYFAPKDDTYAGGQGVPSAGTYIGGWSRTFGVDIKNCYNGNAFQFEFEFDGTNITRVDGSTPANRSPGFVDNNGLDGGSDDVLTEGIGDYTPTVDSALNDHIPAGQTTISWDIFGRAVPTDGTAAAGAVQREAGGDSGEATEGGTGSATTATSASYAMSLYLQSLAISQRRRKRIEDEGANNIRNWRRT